MARGTVEQEIVEQVVGEEGLTNEEEAQEEYSSYAIDGAMSIPVTKAMGKLWDARIKDALDAYKTAHDLWDRVIDEYEKCQGLAIKDIENVTNVGEVPTSSVDENIVRDNIRLLMRTTYGRNPDLSFTSLADGTDDFIKALKRTFDFMANKTSAPGFNLKANMRRWILLGHLTNFGILKLRYQEMEGSRDEALKEFAKCEEEINNATDEESIDEILGKLSAMYERLPLMRQRGISLEPSYTKGLLLDPATTDVSLSTCDWAVELVPLDEDFVNATYYQKNEDGELVLNAKPEHKKKYEHRDRADQSKEAVQTEILATVMGSTPSDLDKLRMQNKVLCYRIYDRILKRIYLYRHDDMAYPLHAYQETLGLSRFYPFFLLAFNEPVDSIIQPGEASYYMGFAEEINKTSRKIKQMRDSVFGALLYDSTQTDKNEVEKLIKHLNNPNEVKAFGVAKPEGMSKISEMLEVFAPPALDMEGLFNTTNIRTTLNKSSGVTDIQQGQQFKTNTTNEAVQFYKQIRNEGTVPIIDTVEEQAEDLAWAICEILVSKYTREEVAEMIGPELGQHFQNMSIEQFNQQYIMEVAAGSIEKPTSEWKKQEAMEIGQVLGQFGSTAPVTITKILLRLFDSAFSDLSIRDSDWTQLEQEAQAQMTKGVSVPNEQR